MFLSILQKRQNNSPILLTENRGREELSLSKLWREATGKAKNTRYFSPRSMSYSQHDITPCVLPFFYFSVFKPASYHRSSSELSLAKPCCSPALGLGSSNEQ